MRKFESMHEEKVKSPMASLRRIHSFRRIFEIYMILVFGVLSLGARPEAAPLETRNERASNEETFAGLPSKTGHEAEVGSPSELAWQAWLLVGGQPNSQSSSSFDSASLLRKITPKSIFIAPALTACAEGYQADTMNRCVKDVSIDRQAHLGFLIERLNAKYGNAAKPQASSSSFSSSSSSQPTGPLQLSIPLLVSGSFNPIHESPSKSSLEKKQPIDENPPSTLKNKKNNNEETIDRETNKSHDRDAVVTIYKLDEPKRDEGTFSIGNKSINDEHSETESADIDKIVPLDESANDSNVNGPAIVDYKIPADKTLNLTTSNYDNASKKDAEISPTVVLLLSPTKLPVESLSGSSDLIVAQNSSLGQVIIKVENITGNVTGKEIIRVRVPENLSSETLSRINVSQVDEKTVKTTDLVDSEENDDMTDDIVDGLYPRDESTEIYDDDTDDVNYEDTTEADDEILKHSEAGMTVTLPTFNESIGQTTIKYNKNVGNRSDREPTGSSEISSEVSINGDFVRETTLVDFNVSRTTSDATRSTVTFDKSNGQETTMIPVVGSKELEEPETMIVSDDIRNDKRDDHLSNIDDLTVEDLPLEKMKINHDSAKDSTNKRIPDTAYPVRGIEEHFEDSLGVDNLSTERTDSGETMIAASTNDATVMSHEMPKLDKLEKRVPFGLSEETTTLKIPFLPASSKSEGIYDYETRDYQTDRRKPYVDDDSQPVIRTLPPIELPYRPSENYDLPRNENVNFFPSSRDYVRFPNYEDRRDERVRFPSDEANSISNDYKDRNRRPYSNQREVYDEGFDASGIDLPDVRQKEAYWWLPTGSRDDRQQQDSFRQRIRTSDQRSRDRAPMLLRFWTRMPLLRDPSLIYPTRPSVAERRQGNSRIEGRSSSVSSSGSSRRVHYYKEMSNHDVNRAFGRGKRAIG